MVKKLHVEGHAALKETLADNKSDSNTVFVLFSGSLGADGRSWCPDCVTADPVINECLKNADDDAIFIHCGVGDRSYWKDQSNAFRTDAELRVKCVPTLIRLGKPQRLEEES